MTETIYVPERGQVPVEQVSTRDYRIIGTPKFSNVGELRKALDSEPDRAVLRCEFMFLMSKDFKSSKTFPELAGDIKESVEMMSSASAYYRSAIEWLHSSENMVSLYTWKDLEFPITWLEAAYMLYYVLEQPATLNWVEVSQSVPQGIGISVVKLTRDEVETISPRLVDHKGTATMDLWLNNMRTHGSYIPLIAWCSVADALHRLEMDIPVEEVMFKEMSAQDYDLFKRLINV